MNVSGFVCYQLAAVIALVALAFMSVITWRHRHINGMNAMTALLVTTFVWSLFSYLTTNSQTLEGQSLFFKLQFLGRMGIPPAWLVFTANYTVGEKPLTPWKIVPLCIFPLVTVLLILFDGGDGLFTSQEYLARSGPFLVSERIYGPIFWSALAYNYTLIAIGIIILLRRLFNGIGLYKKQAGLLLMAISFPSAWNVIYTFNLIPALRIDLAPLTFTISITILVFGLLRFSLFDMVPFAQKYLMQYMKDGILVFDMHARLLEANRAALKMLDISGEFYGKRLKDLSGLSGVMDRLPPSETGIEELPLTISEEERIFELEYVRIKDIKSYDLGLLVTLHDITKRKHMEQQLIAQDRLASIGELTAGVAHEINNPLAIIKGFTELLSQNDLTDEAKNDINNINGEVDRIIKIVENLLAFARRQPEEKETVDINKIIGKTLALRLYEQKSNGIHTVTDLSDDLPKITGNGLQLRQVLVNIIMNAEYFMKNAHGKGELTVTTERKGGDILVRIHDDGPGIRQKDIEHVFNPFFTTKDVGEGTGLGLSICHGIITEHGGSIRVESEPGIGTTVEILLPAGTQG